MAHNTDYHFAQSRYNIAKAYHPIGLLDTLGKLFSTLVTADLSYLAEKHNLLPPTQFGWRPSRCTTDAMHLITHKVKSAWQNQKVAAALFLDIQAAFPNTIKDRLLHNMKTCWVLAAYIKLFDRMLSNHTTQLHFDDFLSDPIQINNGTTQGCLLSMLLYAFYNADLINIAKGRNKLSMGFVDDCAFVAVADMLNEAHTILRDMMECTGGGLEWSHRHNSLFELSKLAVMDFACTRNNVPSAPLTIDRTDSDGTLTPHSIAAVDTYKYLRVVFNPKLKWWAHVSKVVASTTWWSWQLWQILKTTGGLSPSKTHQLYNTIAVPAFTYAANVWYILPYKPFHAKNSRGSDGEMKLLHLVQGRVTQYITRGIHGTAYNVLEAHANVLPIDLLFRKVQFHTATCIGALPLRHPL